MFSSGQTQIELALHVNYDEFSRVDFKVSLYVDKCSENVSSFDRTMLVYDIVFGLPDTIAQIQHPNPSFELLVYA